MYSGPGSGPMLAAAAAWDGLATDLQTAGAVYQSVISDLTSGSWRGPASMSMAASAATYVSWLTTTALQAEQAATQARAAASAHETAFAMTVPPPVIAANRSLLMSLVAANVLGQNTPAIAATDLHYGEMWAQDAAAMYGYADASAAAAKVTPFTPPRATTTAAGLIKQGIAVTQAASTSAGAHTQDAMLTSSRLISAVPQALQALASPSSTSGASSLLSASGLRSALNDLSGHLRTTMSTLSFVNGAAGASRSGNVIGTAAGSSVQTGSAGATLGSAGLSGLGAGSGGVLSANMGGASSMGTLSVPRSWAAAAPVVGPASAALPSIGSNTAPVSGVSGVPVMPIGGTAGRGTSRLADSSRFLLRRNMVPHWPAGG